MFPGTPPRLRVGTGLAVAPFAHPASIAVPTIRPNQIAAVLVLASLATSAYFFAQGTTSLLAARLFGIDDGAAPAAGNTRRSPPATPVRARRNAERIIARNIFEPPAPPSDAGVSEAGEAPAVAALTLEDLMRTNAPPCAAELKMTGAMIHPSLPEWSYASLGQGSSEPLLYRVGSTFAGRQVVLIDVGPDPDSPPMPGGIRRPRTRTVLRDAGNALCQITMFTPPQAGQTAASTSAPPPAAVAAVAPGSAGSPPGATPAPGAEISAAELDQGITRASDTAFVVQRSLMERALAQQDSLFRTARLIPNEVNGAVDGMKVYGIRRSSVLGRLGLQNGDVLQNVNGQSMASADALAQAYQSLGRAGTFSISVVRRGQPMTIQYQVQ